MEFQYQLLFILNFLVCFLLMKALSWFSTIPQKRPPFLFFMFGNPYLSPRTLRTRTPRPVTNPWLNFLLYVFLMGTIFTLVRFFLSPISYFDRILLGFGIFFFTEALGALGQALFSRGNKHFLPIHFHPLVSPSLSEFWGRRWNLWVQDWIADMGRPFHRNQKKKIIASFLVSGIFHEAMVNLPHWLLTGESYFGTMLLYFVIQGAGLFVDKKFVRGYSPVLRRIYCWIVIIAPLPLFINVPALTFFGVTN